MKGEEKMITKSRYRGIVVGLLGLALSIGGVVNQVPEAQALSFDINNCWSSCTGLPSPATVATLDIKQNGTNVDFTLANSVGNLGGFATVKTVISNFYSTYTGASLVAKDFSVVTGGATGVFAIGDRTNAGLQFNLILDLLRGGKTPSTFINGETVKWTVSNDSVANFTSGLNGQSQFLLVHIQRLANDASTKYVNNGAVPEPASLLLLGAGLAGIGIWRWKSAKS